MGFFNISDNDFLNDGQNPYPFYLKNTTWLRWKVLYRLYGHEQ